MLDRQASAACGWFRRGFSLTRRVAAVGALAVLASSAIAQVQFDELGIARMPADRDSTVAVVLGDVDGDGDPDLAFANRGANLLHSNLLRQLDTPLRVIPGREYRVDAYARYGVPRSMDVAFPFVSTATARIPLPPLGTLGLDPTLMIPLPPFVIPRPSGKGFVSVILPNDPNLVGVTIYAQAFARAAPGAFAPDQRDGGPGCAQVSAAR